jgi:hypothetical protein
MGKTTVFGVKLNNRTETAPKFQEIITKYGCNIKTRIGLHEVTDNICSPSGIILLEVIGKDSEITGMESEISKLKEVNIQKMIF